jgi:hypothetical protein
MAAGVVAVDLLCAGFSKPVTLPKLYLSPSAAAEPGALPLRLTAPTATSAGMAATQHSDRT